MVADGVVPNASTFLTLLRGCQAARSPALAAEVYVEMRLSGLRPSSAHFQSLLIALGEADLSAGPLPAWLLSSAESNGQTLLDFHGLSSAEARAAVLCALRAVREQPMRSSGLTLVTGSSGHSNAPVIRNAILRLCAELRVECKRDARNAGRLHISRDALRDWRDRAAVRR
jgi:pentatricopeptide repeat protein